MLVVKKLTNKGTQHSKTAKLSISNLWDRPSSEGTECLHPFLAFSSKDSVSIPSHIKNAKSQNLRMGTITITWPKPLHIHSSGNVDPQRQSALIGLPQLLSGNQLFKTYLVQRFFLYIKSIIYFLSIRTLRTGYNCPNSCGYHWNSEADEIFKMLKGSWKAPRRSWKLKNG